ncbi:subtilase-type protease inhibitor [Streptomyces sp. NPDC049577]|uniref:subtilase-type protease inhibitor n=1 Tax=Streptomyces sp. NPDC049577 TaxID=3155153 RepID=UPI003426F250
MRYITGGIALAAALGMAGLAGAGTAANAAPSSTQSLYAPSALVLTVAQGDDPATAGVQRAVTLTCTPKAGGTHPAVSDACAALRAAGGDFNKVTTIKAGTFCTKEYNPTLVTAEGVWDGKRVSYKRVFANPCEREAGKGVVFNF